MSWLSQLIKKPKITITADNLRWALQTLHPGKDLNETELDFITMFEAVVPDGKLKISL